jgi:hypothetical protein
MSSFGNPDAASLTRATRTLCDCGSVGERRREIGRGVVLDRIEDLVGE